MDLSAIVQEQPHHLEVPALSCSHEAGYVVLYAYVKRL